MNVALLPIGLPRVALLEGEWQLCLRAEALPARRLAAPVATVLPVWIEAARQGGYGMVDDVDEQDTGLIERPIGADADAQALLVFGVRALDPRAFQILRSALLAQLARWPVEAAEAEAEDDDEESSLHRLASQLGGARLILLPRGRIAADFTVLPGSDGESGREGVSEYDLYPAPPRYPPFALAWMQQQGTLRRCVVSFTTRVDAALLASLRTHLHSWAQLLALGGFEQPTRAAGRCLACFGGVQLFEEDSAEIVVDTFEAAEGAWNILAHLLVRFARVHPIVSVEIH